MSTSRGERPLAYSHQPPTLEQKLANYRQYLAGLDRRISQLEAKFKDSGLDVDGEDLRKLKSIRENNGEIVRSAIEALEKGEVVGTDVELPPVTEEQVEQFAQEQLAQ